jgi:hypothetical protein
MARHVVLLRGVNSECERQIAAHFGLEIQVLVQTRAEPPLQRASTAG